VAKTPAQVALKHDDRRGNAPTMRSLSVLCLTLATIGGGAAYWLTRATAPQALAKTQVHVEAVQSAAEIRRDSEAAPEPEPRPHPPEHASDLSLAPAAAPLPRGSTPAAEHVESGGRALAETPNEGMPKARPAPRPTRSAPLLLAKRSDKVFPSPADELARSDASSQSQSFSQPGEGTTSTHIESSVGGARTIDELYEQRTATECGAGPIGFVCRESVRFGLCRDLWSSNAVRGKTVCRVLARAGPAPDQ
jgi:hypothetical protein